MTSLVSTTLRTNPPPSLGTTVPVSVSRRVGELRERVGRQLAADWVAEGRLAEICRHALSVPGKYFRPVLLLESAAAVGGDLEQVLSAAAGAEGAHVASLIHDDIIDGDEVRRGIPAVHTAFGRDDAILGGDALIFYLFAALARCAATGVEPHRIVLAMRLAAEAGTDLCRGQLMEEQIRAAYDLGIRSYLSMVEHKTAAMFRACCGIGSVLGGGDPEQVRALAEFGTALGIAFQIQDDVLPYTAQSADTGKSASSDVANGRLTLPFLVCHAKADAALAAELDALLLENGDAEARHRELGALFAEHGAIRRTAEYARHYADKAVEALAALPPSESKDTLGYFAEAAVQRWR